VVLRPARVMSSAFSGAVFWTARYGFGLTIAQTQTASFLWLVFAGGQTALYLARACGVFWARPHPGRWLIWASVFDIAAVAVMAWQGWLMTPISWAWMGALFGVSLAFLATGNALRLAATALIHRSPPARAARAGQTHHQPA
jgi:hypothetical protein